jgi:hypothetical protein
MISLFKTKMLKMKTENKNMSEIIQDEGLINDFEFETRIYEAGLLEDFQSYIGKKRLIYSHMF